MPVIRCEPAGSAAAGGATLFDGLSAQPPDQIALYDADGSLTFAQLLHQASQLAGYLNENGVGPSDHVLVRGDRSIGNAVAIYAVLIAGAGFLAVPARVPASSVHALNRQAAITTVLGETEADMNEVRSSPVMWQLNYREFLRNLPLSCPYSEPAYPLLSSQAATVVFPDGLCRGIVFSHAALLATLHDAALRFGIDARDRLFGTALMGDAQTLADLFLPALTGCAAILHTPEDVNVGGALALAHRYGATIWHGPASDLASLGPAPWPDTIRLCLASTPGLAPTLPASFLQAMPPVPFAALDTLSELTISATCRAANALHAFQLAGARAAIVDAHVQSCPPLMDGAVCLGGPSLAQEYINDATVSAHTFVQAPGGDRALRGALRGRLLSDGALELLAPRTHVVIDSQLEII